ncbi:hypothetical protein bthur0001_56050 [Bacillus thuringiensis serovar tochigiensis BGSC 4Y1]|nr:hypothetical protein bthur0001_56050 [Bacillus thuringiensis serovar tochigiensis BGSC 4Y1]
MYIKNMGIVTFVFNNKKEWWNPISLHYRYNKEFLMRF